VTLLIGSILLLPWLPSAKAATPVVASWVIQAPGEQSYDLHGIYMVSPDEGYAVGGATTASSSNCFFADGVLLPTCHPATGPNGSPESTATILSTDDGGQTWTPLTLPASAEELYGIAGVSANGTTSLTAVGVNRTVLYQTSGGTWQGGSCTPECGNLDGASFTVDGSVYGWAADSLSSLDLSTDGGKTWTQDLELSPLERSPAFLGVSTTTVGQAVYAWAISDNLSVSPAQPQVWEDTAATSFTSTWSLLDTLPFVPYGVDFANAEDGWLVGSGGTIWATTDGGQHWTPQASGTGEDLFAVSFIPGTEIGFAVGAHGTILMTTDGGTTWALEASPTTADLYGVFAFQQGGVDYAWAVGQGGVIVAFDQPAAITLAANPSTLYVGQPSSLTGDVTGTVYAYAYAMAFPNATVSLSAPDGGGGIQPSATSTDSVGAYGATFTATGPPGVFPITAAVYGTSVTASTTVTVLATPPPQEPTACGAITLPPGSPLTAVGVMATPAGIPPDAQPASCVFHLTGPPLPSPELVTLAYDPAVLGGLPTSRISVFQLRANGMWTFLPTATDSTAGTATVRVDGPVTIVALADLQRFPDVPPGFWAKADIDLAAGTEMVDGFPPPFDGLYEPSAPITRAQATKMVVIDAGLLPGLGGVLPSSAATPFTDVPPSAWYAPYVATGLASGIVQGLAPHRFAPGQPVSRQAFATMLARALHLTGTSPDRFRDENQIAPWAAAAVSAVVAAGYMEGLPGGFFAPTSPLTRAEAAEVMARVVASQEPAPP
jgi:photosystem II stability/assembly factor-like uncharacterized protein